MNEDIKGLASNLESKDDIVRKTALDALMALTEEKVEWITDVLDIICDKFSSDNSYQRNIAAMLTASLAKSDAKGVLLGEAMERFVSQMDDVKFITARITLQAAGRYALAGEAYAKEIAAGLVETLKSNRHHDTHGNLIRLDAVTSLREILRCYPDTVDAPAAREAVRQRCDAKEAAKLLPMLEM